MKHLTVRELRQLQYGEAINSITKNGKIIQFQFCGILPANKDYIVLCCGTKCETLYCPEYENNSLNEIPTNCYSGNFDAEFLGNKIIEYHQEQIKAIKWAYLTNTNAQP